jgi:hypothetical protein
MHERAHKTASKGVRLIAEVPEAPRQGPSVADARWPMVGAAAAEQHSSTPRMCIRPPAQIDAHPGCFASTRESPKHCLLTLVKPPTPASTPL